VKTETVTLIGKSRWNLTCFVYFVYEINIKVFFLTDILFLGVCLRLQSSCILVNMLLECIFDQFCRCDLNFY